MSLIINGRIQINISKDPIDHAPEAGGTAIINLNASFKHNITMPAGNITIAVISETKGDIFTIRILQDAIGGRTVTWFTAIKWAEGGTPPTLTITGNKADSFTFSVAGANKYDGYTVGQNL